MAHLSLNSPLGPLTLFEEQGSLIALEWARAPNGGSSDLLTEARDQLNAYFDGRLKRFDLPLKPSGTPFQRSVWALMSKVPYGRTRTYGDVALALESAPRAVGGACGRNPIPIIIPCHRIIGANGRMTGYSGAGGVDAKQALLSLESG